MSDTITIFPVTGWSSATLPEGNAMLTVDYLPIAPTPRMTTDDLRKAEQSIRLGMTAEQCDELALVLQRMAAESRRRRGASN